MSLPRPLLHEVKFPQYKYPVWQVSPMTDAERAEVAALLPILERRLIPADHSTAYNLVADAIKKNNPNSLTEGTIALISAKIHGFSVDTILASIKSVGVKYIIPLCDEMERRRDNAEIFLYRCRVLLGIKPAQWYETPGDAVPESKIKQTNTD